MVGDFQGLIPQPPGILLQKFKFLLDVDQGPGRNSGFFPHHFLKFLFLVFRARRGKLVHELRFLDGLYDRREEPFIQQHFDPKQIENGLGQVAGGGFEGLPIDRAGMPSHILQGKIRRGPEIDKARPVSRIDLQQSKPDVIDDAGIISGIAVDSLRHDEMSRHHGCDLDPGHQRLVIENQLVGRSRCLLGNQGRTMMAQPIIVIGAGEQINFGRGIFRCDKFLDAPQPLLQ